MPDPFSQLLEWRRSEASARVLAKLSPEFYTGTARYLGELRRSYEIDLRENPSGRKGEISRQTYQRASQVARDILEGRLQKLLSAAFQASVGGTRELPNALAEERAIFDQLLATLLEFRRASAPYLETGPSVVGAPAAAPPPAPAAAPTAAPPAAPRPPSPAPRATGPPSPTYVRIVRTTRPLELGAERVDLREDDVLSLTPDAAKILVDGKIAEPLATVPVPKGR
jgi:DNA replication initiation complex subunit (GINS family)